MLTDGVGYRLALPPPRSTTLAGARVLVLAQHPLGPTDAPVAVAVEALAAGLEKAGAKVARGSGFRSGKLSAQAICELAPGSP